jgi:hypothetical protein
MDPPLNFFILTRFVKIGTNRELCRLMVVQKMLKEIKSNRV